MSIFAHQPINGIICGLNICNYYILSSLSHCTTQAGKPYLRGVLSDASGRVAFVMWDNLPNLTDADVGKVVYIDGEVQEYRNAPQIKLDMICLATDDDIAKIQMSDLVPYAPINVGNATSGMAVTLAGFLDSSYRDLASTIFFEFLPLLSVAPAAKSIHHAFVGGWVMHTWHMMRLAEQVYQQYKDIMSIDHDLLLTGTFLHDIGKLREFDLTKQNLVKDYSTNGRLLGHPMLGVMMVEDTVNKYLPDADPEKVCRCYNDVLQKIKKDSE